MTVPRRHDFDDIPDPFAGAPLTDAKSPPLAMTPSATRRNARSRRVAAAAAAVLLEFGMLAMLGRRSTDGLSARWVLIAIGVPLASSAALVFAAAAGRVRRGLGVATIALAFALCFATIIATSAAGDGSYAGMRLCLMGGMMAGGVPAMIAFSALRHAFATRAFLRSSAFALACGLLGAATIRAYCPNDDLVHLLVAHALPALLVTTVGAVVGARLTRA